VAGAVAKALELPHLDTGATYRAAALAVLRKGGDPSDPAAVLESIDGVELSFDGAAVMLTDVTGSQLSLMAAVPDDDVARRLRGLLDTWEAEVDADAEAIAGGLR